MNVIMLSVTFYIVILNAIMLSVKFSNEAPTTLSITTLIITTLYIHSYVFVCA